jgi:glycerol-3-phosphate cytidylyltransferase-like family protein
MPHKNSASYYSNRYNAQPACQHCEAIVHHEPWCLTINPVVHYACEIVAYPDKLTAGDAIVLHSLGVLWSYSDR